MVNFVIEKFFPAKSASMTIIAKGIYNDANAYFKIFKNDMTDVNLQSLDYEGKVYNKIRSKSRENKNNGEQMFMQLYGYLQTTFEFLKRDSNISTYALNDPEQNKILSDRFAALSINDNTPILIIITEDTNSISLNDYFKKLNNSYIPDRNEMTHRIFDLFFVLFTAVHILNNMIRIQHNDLHIGNILVKEQRTNYYIPSIRTHPPGIFSSKYRITIYDFDRAYCEPHDNPLILATGLCNDGHSCNSISLRDKFSIINGFINIYYAYTNNPNHSDYTNLTDSIILLIKKIFTRDHQHIILNAQLDLVRNIQHPLTYCFDDKNKYTSTRPCPNALVQDSTMTTLIEPIYDKLLAIIAPNKEDCKFYYYKKYIKYKKKYLKINNK
jgi:hypothetical protein